MKRSLCVSTSLVGVLLALSACTAGPGKGQSGDGDGPGGPDECTTVHLGACDGSNVGSRLLRRLARGELLNSLTDIFPNATETVGGLRLSSDPASEHGFTTDAATLLVSGSFSRELSGAAEELADQLTSAEALATILPCATTSPDDACTRSFLDTHGVRLHRRALSEEEIAEYLAHQKSIADRSDYVTGLKWMIVGLIQSPFTLYRSELGESDGQSYRLRPDEIATNLAYTYSGTTPSEQLLARAEAGELASPEARRAVAAELLETESGRETVHRFFEEWLGYRQILGETRADEPTFADEVSPLLIEETRRFLDAVVFEDLGSFTSLMTADYTVVNQRLSDFYGFGPVSDWARVSRPEGQGAGLLGQGSILATTSHQEATSPTWRGLLFFEKFLCQPAPQLPPDVPPLEETTGNTDVPTTREKYEIVHAVGPCGNCHRQFEPFGYALEQFDETGRYRADENGAPINTVADLEWPTTACQTESRQVANAAELTRVIEETEDVESCVSGLMTAYFLSNTHSGCASGDARNASLQGGVSIKDYILSFAASDHFAERVSGSSSCEE